MKHIGRFIRWILSFFEKSKTPHIDGEIKKKQKIIKDIDEELKKKYTDVDEAMSEWEED